MSKDDKDLKKGLSGYVKYSNIAFQMILIIGSFAYVGKYLDTYFHNERPWIFTSLALIGVIMSIYFVIYTVNSKK